MAGSMKDIRLRIRSVQNTMQITKAMQLVAASKLRRAKERAEATRAYYTGLYETMCDLAERNTEYTSPYAASREINRRCYIVIAGDRGLAGGYNNNLFKAVKAAGGESENAVVLPIGRKALEYYRRRGVEIISDSYANAENLSIRDTKEIAKIICGGFLKGDFDIVSVGYTKFNSMLSQTPDVIDVLPLCELKHEGGAKPAEGMSRPELTLYEPNSDAAFDIIIPEYVAGLVCGTLRESFASEQAARRMAMDSASKNAGEIIEKLDLSYNRARQGAITQEITEIVAGAEA
ncbi:MAG: ATP synthase F1 subunit gamma [Oscillospiraceae bacterium]|nr:ATP synthase F1 subunit gamma [Oscillospiraceae bacterium]